MGKVVSRLAGMLITIYFLSFVFDSVVIEKNSALLWFGLILFAVGLLLKPLFLAIGLPVSLVTLGVFVVVIEAWIIMIADKMTPGIEIGGFINAFIIALVGLVIEAFARESEYKTETAVLKGATKS